MGLVRLHELDITTEGKWSFRESAPMFEGAKFDPFPCYPHDVDVVNEQLKEVVDCWWPSYDINLYLANREEVGRSNGYSGLSNGRYVYSMEGREWDDTPVGSIMFSGKRVPPHPAVSRYLVAHEYGHQVEYMLNLAAGEHYYSDKIITEYAAVRGLGEANLHNGEGGTWHDSATEVFACDFRILVCGVEPWFWPHPGIAYPSDLAGLVGWWDNAAEQWNAKVAA